MNRLIGFSDCPLILDSIERLAPLPAKFLRCDSLQALYTALWKNSHDALLIDLDLSAGNGLDVLKQTFVHQPKLKVLALTSQHDDFAYRCYRLGALAVLPIKSPLPALKAALASVLNGQRVIEQPILERLCLGKGKTDVPTDILSNREYQVLGLIVAGKTVSQIAREFGRSVKTVSTYRERILTKLHRNNNAELMRYGLDNGLG